MVTPGRDGDTCAPWIVVCLWLGLQDLVRPDWPASVCLTEMGGWVCLPFSGYDVRGSDANRTGLVGGWYGARYDAVNVREGGSVLSVVPTVSH
jgi:hypothetical protein